MAVLLHLSSTSPSKQHHPFRSIVVASLLMGNSWSGSLKRRFRSAVQYSSGCVDVCWETSLSHGPFFGFEILPNKCPRHVRKTMSGCQQATSQIHTLTR